MFVDVALQGSIHPFTDLLNLNSAPSAAANPLIVDLYESSPAASIDVCEENFQRWDS